MLSITKLAGRSMADLHNCVNYPDERGNEEQRGRDPFDEPRTALEAVDDYYDAGGVPSQWHGRAAVELGLIGHSTREQRRALMQGYGPSESRWAGEGLVQNPGVARAYGWDLTFSPSKSVSVAWALADEKTRTAIERAHDEAVVTALAEAERRLYARRGKDGAERDFTAGLVAATFRHASARPVNDEQGQTVVDPQLHTHAQVMNLSLSADGHTGAAALNEIYRSKRELDGVYMASLAVQLHNLGFAVERDTRNDSFRLTDVPQALEKAFSHRRSEIERLMHEKGWEGARGAQYATLLTREGKEHLEPDAVIAEAQVRARERGFNVPADTLLRQNGQAGEIDLSALAQDLTQTRSVLKQTEVRITALLHAQWAGLGPAAADEAIAALTRQGELVTLYSPEATLYTTRAMVELERRMLASAEQLHAQAAHAIAPQALQASVKQWQQQTGVTLNEGQRAALDYITAGGDLRLLQGLPGTGKSTLLAAAQAVWSEAGYTVRGAAPTGKAAANLGESIADSQTLARMMREWGEWSDDEGHLHGASRPLTEKDIVVIDEAGMVDSATLERVLHHAQLAGAKVVLVGDERQLQPVTAGAPLKYLRERFGAGQLAEIVRQRDLSERERVAALHAGEVRAVFDALYAEGRVQLTDNRRDAVMATVERWAAHHTAGSSHEAVMVTGSNEAARELNVAARTWLKARGELSGESHTFVTHDRQGYERTLVLTTGDRIVFRQNCYEDGLDVRNGHRASVERIESDASGRRWIAARVDETGALVCFSPDPPPAQSSTVHEQAQPYTRIEHGYAQTVYTAQGSTVDYGIYYVAGIKSAELALVALSRHRESSEVVFSREAVTEIAERLPPTAAMRKYVADVAEQEGIALGEAAPEFHDFQAARDYLDGHTMHRLGETRRYGEWQEAVAATMSALAERRENAVTLDYSAQGSGRAARALNNIAEEVLSQAERFQVVYDSVTGLPSRIDSVKDPEAAIPPEPRRRDSGHTIRDDPSPFHRYTSFMDDLGERGFRQMPEHTRGRTLGK